MTRRKVFLVLAVLMTTGACSGDEIVGVPRSTPASGPLPEENVRELDNAPPDKCRIYRNCYRADF